MRCSFLGLAWGALLCLSAGAFGCQSGNRWPAEPMLGNVPVPAVAEVMGAPNSVASSDPGGDVLSGAWPKAKSHELLAKTRTLNLAPDLSSLTPGERGCVAKLVEVGDILQNISESSLHKDAARARVALSAPRAPQELRSLFRLFSGPIATTLDNERQPFVAVSEEVPGKNFYPWGVSKAELENYLGQHPQEREALLDIRTLVRRADTASLNADLETLERHPVLAALHPKLAASLRERAVRARDAGPHEPTGFYAVPYSVGYADELVRAHALLDAAADLVQADDAEFARYLRNRGRDLLTNDYESGDAAWATGRFKRLNAEIGSYETYDDQIYGVKASTAVSILLKDVARTDKLRAAIKDLQAIENSLPYEPHKPVRSDISVGIYDIIADFGQARGTNTATILPNDAEFSRKYGRIIMLRANILRNPELFATASAKWKAAVAAPFAGDLTIDGGFYRTLWHEIGHYLGVDRTADGRTLDLALEENESTFEEMKSDLVALYAVKALNKSGYYDAQQARSVYADGIRRTLLTTKPRRDQPYQTMMLMQLNYFIENGLLKFDDKTALLTIRYENYHNVVGNLLRAVLDVQRQGNRAASDKFIERYTTWKDDVHGRIAERLRAQENFRYTLINYPSVNR